jgi:DNA-binding transcriptional regulator LsrR (DeoR family)
LAGLIIFIAPSFDSLTTEGAMDQITGDRPSSELHRTPRRSERLRQRAAWMYFVEEMTQSAIADALGVGRVTVVRMLAEAKALGEVRIALARGNAELGGLEAALCKAYGFEEAIVAPLSSPSADATAPISAALGEYVSALLRNEMKIGLGWGRTLNRSLEYLRERSLKNLSVVSLAGSRISRMTIRRNFLPPSLAPSTRTAISFRRRRWSTVRRPRRR